jgi:hypothetical protein
VPGRDRPRREPDLVLDPLLAEAIDGVVAGRIGTQTGATERLGGVHSWTLRQIERILSCLDLAAMASEGRCREGGNSSGRLSEAS